MDKKGQRRQLVSTYTSRWELMPSILYAVDGWDGPSLIISLWPILVSVLPTMVIKAGLVIKHPSQG
jgi:hypothetical protein